MKQRIKCKDEAIARLVARPKSGDGIRVGGMFTVRCIGKDGNVKWIDESHNLVVYAGLEYLLDVGLCGGAQVSTWYIGLTAATPVPANGDTMAGGHGGWTEFTNYDEATRQTFVEVRTDRQVDNSASVAVFTISADSSTIGGAFLVSVSTKGGSTGTLLCCVAFTGGNKAADDGDTLEVQYNFTAADDGV